MSSASQDGGGATSDFSPQLLIQLNLSVSCLARNVPATGWQVTAPGGAFHSLAMSLVASGGLWDIHCPVLESSYWEAFYLLN